MYPSGSRMACESKNPMEIGQDRVQLLSEDVNTSKRLCVFTDLKKRRFTERNSLAHNWCPA